MYMLVPCIREKEDDPPAPAKLRRYHGKDCAKLLTLRGRDRLARRKRIIAQPSSCENRINAPPMGSKAIIEAKNFRPEAERESVDLNPTPAADQKKSELVKENRQAQDEKENALYIPRSLLTGRRHVGEFYFSIEPGCTIWPASHPVMMPTTNCDDGFLALATVTRSPRAPALASP